MAAAPENALSDLSLNDSLRDLLECPICFDYCKTPIFMCSNGHHVCNTCQTSLLRCPTCQVEGQPITRCPVLEKMAEKLKVPCANKHEGCDAVLNTEEMAKHWKTCVIKYTFDCEIFIQIEPEAVQCEWEGNRQALVVHLKKDHPGCYSEDEIVQNDVDINFRKRMVYIRLFSAHNKLFWVACFFDEEVTYIYLRLVGKNDNATSYFGKFICRSADGFIENTAIVQSMPPEDEDEDEDEDEGEIRSSPYVLRLAKVTVEHFTSENIFSFTAQILKK